MTRALLLVCMLATTALAQPRGSAVEPPAITEKSRVEVQPAGKSFKQLSIENPLGNVRIEGHDGTAIMIETHKRAPDVDAVDRLRVSLIPDPDGTVRITTHADPGIESKPVARAQVAIDLVIRAPRNARIEAAVGSGTLEVRNMDAGGELDSASGAISVQHVQGDFYTHSVSGRMSISQAFGSVDAATISSDVELDSISGNKVVASANQGTIAGRRVRSREVELTTTSGKISLEAEALVRGRIVVASLKGDVEVKLRRQSQQAMIVRGRGTKVDFGTAAKLSQLGLWQEARFGAHSVDAAFVELRSNHGVVRFAVIQ